MKTLVNAVPRIAIVLFGLAACTSPTGATAVKTDMPVGMPNPASVYCEEQGGRLELRTDEAGTYGVCIFDDGSECEEWAYFRGECAPGGAIDESVLIPSPSAARDTALDYLRASGVEVPADDADWTEENVTPEGLMGSSQFRYAAGDWTVDVSFPIVPPQQIIYTVDVSHIPSGFKWQGEVDAAGRVSELTGQSEHESDQAAVGMPNPASVYCEEQGGRLELRTGEAGTYGVCIFDDGSECEEWAYFLGDCAPGGQ